MKNILTALSVAFVCAACSPPVDFTEYGKGKPTEIELTAHALDTAILYSDGLFVRDSLIINVNPQNRNSLFDIFSKNDFRYLGSCGRIGRGPDEFDFVNTNSMQMGYGGLAFAEINTYCVTDFLVSDGGIQVKKSSSTKMPASCPVANSLLVLSDSTAVLYFENDDDVEFYLHDRTGNSIRPASHYPKSLLPHKMSSAQCGTLFLNDLVLAQSKRRFAAVYSQLPMIRIFDYDGACLATSLLDTRSEQTVTVKDGSVVTSASVQYYLAAAANDSYICALYLGRRPEDMREVAMEDARMEIHVWNWAGEPVATYLPDRLITDLALGDDNTIYALSPLDDSHVFTYKIAL